MPVTAYRTSFAFLIVIIGNFAIGQAQEIVVPIHVQAQFFKKIFGYSQTFSNPSNPFVAIVGADNNYNLKIKAAFEKAAITNVAALTSEEFTAKAKDYEVVYLCPDARMDLIPKLCVSNKILSITGTPSFYESNNISIALKLSDNKCQILLNLDRVKKEGHRFSAAFLSLIKK